jgi:hypothetical protein
MPLSPAVYLCKGKHCRTADGHDELLCALASVADVQLVKCQKVCHGSVVGVCLDNRLEWFERISKSKARVALVEATAVGTAVALPQRLAKRRLTKRSGRPPR